jgi:hypothetical protein
MNPLEIGKTLLKNLDKVGIVILLILCGYLWWKTISLQNHAEEARVEAQNQIAELSGVVRENATSWSRLAQERNDSIDLLQAQLPALATLIQQRNEEITSLTTAVATIRPITVRVIQGEGASQTVVQPVEPGLPSRERVDFDTTQEEFVRIHGFTLTNPAEANLSVEYLRAVNFTVVTTQQEDLSWRSYVDSDMPGLEIGDVQSRVNPISRPQEQRRWEQDIEIGVFGAGAVTGNAGIFGAEVGYDFGALAVGVNAGGITYPGSTDFLVGGRITIAPFDL